MTKISKALSSNKQRALNRALKEYHKPATDTYQYLWVEDTDYDKNEVVYNLETYVNDKYVDKTLKASFSINDDATLAEITSTPVEVVHMNEYEEVPSIVESIIKGIDKCSGSTKEEQAILIVKQFDDDKMIEISKMYIAPNEVDAHGDSMTAEEIVKMVANANEHISKGNLVGNIDHKTNTEQFTFIKAFVAECDMRIGGNFIVEGTPILKIQYHDKELWEKRKSGEFTGWSIGAQAGSVEYVEI